MAGLSQLGIPFFVEPLFNGTMLLRAVGLAVATRRRRARHLAAAPAAVAGQPTP